MNEQIKFDRYFWHKLFAESEVNFFKIRPLI